MDYKTSKFYVQNLYLTILMFIVANFLYGGMSIFAIVKKGFNGTPVEYVLYGWAALMIIASYYYSYKTYIAFKYVKS